MGGGGFAGGGEYRGGGVQMRGAGQSLDYHHVGASHLYQHGAEGLAMPRHPLPHGSEVFMHNVRLQQSDGCASDDITTTENTVTLSQLPFHCPAAAANRRMPRKGDVSLESFSLHLCKNHLT